MPPTPLRDVDQPGLEWKETLWGDEPHWTKEPSIDVIKKLVTRYLHLDEEPHVSFFAQGALNRLFAVHCSKGRFIMRVTLSAVPEMKTKSEVATLAFVRENTTIAVPQVIAYDADIQNELGFEWILMERDAHPLHEVWHAMSWLKKGLLVRQVAGFIAELFKINFSGIGSLYFEDDAAGDKRYVIGETIRPEFFVGDHIQLDVERGPFSTSADYITACLHFLLHDANKLDLEDEDDAEHYQDMQAIHSGVSSILPRLFPKAESLGGTMLYNGDISTSNILVSPSGDLLSIVDWECVAAVPAWQACQLPQFLKGTTRNVMPQFHEEKDYSDVHLDQVELYETTQLRKFFLEEMQRLEPRWVDIFKQERVKQDVLVAIDKAGNDMTVKWAMSWLKVIVEGQREPKMSLTDSCRNPFPEYV